ncbi:MAG: hypothetical protein GWN84_01985 [Gammaproteobacteria bacterium]|nr:hypothetical protein [Gammaproteobacteria bacterium]NIR81930.1 hypothetical protein [Gammaproteobacteria bacterium]NIR88762.1 hypothetical protein [Gammaproteobacteria bacterium]NIU03038.1 hypothetical protein [Gammaproteobacteria bacterium]NIV50559.1 hypothetical protein [Gammaproteobacteria bacterium]
MREARLSLTVGLLHNPLSGRNAKRSKSLSVLCTRYGGVRRRDVRTPDDISAAVAGFLCEGVDVIAVNGGDGTVQATLTALLRSESGGERPLLATLPAGTSNITAADIGVRGNPVRVLGRLLDWTHGAPVRAERVRRAVLRAQLAPDTSPLYGMAFGAGIIYEGTRYTHERLYRLGLRGQYAPGVALARFVVAMLRGDRGIVAPVPIGVGVGGEAPVTHPSMVLVVSTLERLFLGLRPYWGTEDGALHYTQIYARPRHLLRALPAILRGRPNRFATPEHGYVSRNVDSMRLTLEGGFTLDGELYETHESAAPLVLSHGGEIDFLRI